MSSEKLIFGIGGLVVGLVIGFSVANSVNRSVVNDNSFSGSKISTASNSILPPNHPPISGDDDAAGGEALPQVTAAIEKAKSEPENFEAQMTAGDLYYQIQRFNDAIEFYEKANRLRPAETEPLIKLGNTYFDSEQYPEAERSYTAVLKRTPNDVNVRTDLGLTFFLRAPRDLDRAIKEFSAALSIKPDNEMALQNLALVFKDKNDQSNFEKTLRKLAEVNPNNPLLLKEREKKAEK